MSCIYGPHQFGNEDQGWVAHFVISALKGAPITLYGDGVQVRDVLYIDDLLDALLLAQVYMRKMSGEAFNIGGGLANSIGLQELVALIERLRGGKVATRKDAWRAADQRYYVSDTRKFESPTGWHAKVDLVTGVGRLLEWLADANSGGATASAFGSAS
jgi:CDP-paratose 2-epimerase